MFDENLDAFLNVCEHANQIVIQKSGKVFNGIIEKQYIETNEVAGYQPVLICKTNDIKELVRGDLIEDGRAVYKFIYKQPDGTGMSEAVLNFYSDSPL